MQKNMNAKETNFPMEIMDIPKIFFSSGSSAAAAFTMAFLFPVALNFHALAWLPTSETLPTLVSFFLLLRGVEVGVFHKIFPPLLEPDAANLDPAAGLLVQALDDLVILPVTLMFLVVVVVVLVFFFL
mmetsp:Transcript_29469/g.62557  ORF Transcript_29469/g.62557 Transcript_29469/m.62557 type:complete len:128 (+) Transcript_29469:188-571(+)